MKKFIQKLQTPARGIARIIFWIKVFSYCYLASLILVYYRNEIDQYSELPYMLAGFLFIPFLTHLTIKYFNNSIKVAIVTQLLDSFLLGLLTGILHYSFAVAMVFLSIAFSNTIAFRGFRYSIHIIICFIAGIGIPYYFFNVPIDFNGSLISNGASILLMAFYFPMFAYAAFRTSVGYKSAKNKFKLMNQQIDESVRFAEKIQHSVLKRDEIQSKFKETYFIWFEPKDVVSGDFYWIYEKEEFIYVAVGDCTGHGVPGGLLTMLGTTFLNEILSSKTVLPPSEILEKLQEKITAEMTTDSEILRDGMDISLAKLNLIDHQLEWSGAYNPLYIIRKDNQTPEAKEQTVEIIKADRFSLGYSTKMVKFTNHSIQLSSGDLIYLFSDGFADQFGGPRGKKFGYSRFRKLLVEICKLPMNQQKQRLLAAYQNWKNQQNNEQVDDISIIGIKI